MRETPVVKTAVVRGVPDTYARCIRSEPGPPIDVTAARAQHAAYCGALERAGVRIVRIEADDRFPDCCFVEDPAVVVDECAVVANMGAEARRGEVEAVEAVLEGLGREVVVIEAPATLEGGDVLRIDDQVFVGLTDRTNRAGVEALDSILRPRGYQVVPVVLHDALHLKSVCAYVGSGYVVVARGHFDDAVFAAYEEIEIAPQDGYSVNCLGVNGTVLVAEGFPGTCEKLEKAGFAVTELPVLEFRKADGGLSCLSLRF